MQAATLLASAAVRKVAITLSSCHLIYFLPTHHIAGGLSLWTGESCQHTLTVMHDSTVALALYTAVLTTQHVTTLALPA